jgi:predicted nucleic acid-binding Zn ribbon protein
MTPIAHRRAPRPLSLAVERLQEALAPATPLARIQSRWAETVGPAIAACARPVAERRGVLTISCDAATWAAELQMMGPELAERLNAALGEPLVAEVHCRTG